MVTELEWIKNIHDNLKIPPSSFGFAGEVYAKFYECEEEYKKIIGKYIFIYQATCINRKAIYYSVSFEDVLSILREADSDYLVISQSKILFEYKRYVLFTMVEYVMHAVCKLLNICFENNGFREKFYILLKKKLNYYTDILVSLMFSDNFPDLKPIELDFIGKIENIYIAENISPLREHVEMDNKMILVLGYVLYADYIERCDLLICPLLGSAQIPPFFNSLEILFSKNDCIPKQIQYDYVKYSTYDITDYLPFEEQLNDIMNHFDKDKKILILDESLGTGRTVLAIKQSLRNHFNSIAVASIEFKWDKKIAWDEKYAWFDIDEIDLITPISYRDWFLLSNQTASFKRNTAYIQPYIPYMVYDDPGFASYMSAQKISIEKQNIIDELFCISKNMKMIFYP